MTSKEIEGTAATDISTNTWLREICLQLAYLNEKQTQAPANPIPAKQAYKHGNRS